MNVHERDVYQPTITDKVAPVAVVVQDTRVAVEQVALAGLYSIAVVASVVMAGLCSTLAFALAQAIALYSAVASVLVEVEGQYSTADTREVLIDLSATAVEETGTHKD